MQNQKGNIRDFNVDTEQPDFDFSVGCDPMLRRSETLPGVVLLLEGLRPDEKVLVCLVQSGQSQETHEFDQAKYF